MNSSKMWDTMVNAELDTAMGRFRSFNSHHEAYAIIKEELEEWWDSVKADAPDVDELIQLGAMVKRAYMDLGVKAENPNSVEVEIV